MNIYKKIKNHKKNKKIQKIKDSLSYCGENVSIHEDLRVSCPEAIKIGNNVAIDTDARLLCWNKYNMVDPVQYLTPKLTIGDGCHITRNLTIQCAGYIEIGKDVLIASNVLIIDYNHGSDPEKSDYLQQNLLVKSVVIGDACWIGQNVIILPGVTIGEHSIIGAGSIVTKSVPPYSIAVGNPAKCIKQFDFSIKKWTSLS